MSISGVPVVQLGGGHEAVLCVGSIPCGGGMLRRSHVVVCVGGTALKIGQVIMSQARLGTNYHPGRCILIVDLQHRRCGRGRVQPEEPILANAYRWLIRTRNGNRAEPAPLVRNLSEFRTWFYCTH